MNSHLAIVVDGHELALRPDQSIDIEDQNPLFNDVEMFSYPFEMPFENNRVLLKNMDDPNSDLRPVDMERKKAVILSEGLPIRSGVTIIQEDETLESGMSMNIDASTRSFDDLIGDLECQDVPLKDEIQIGEKIGNVNVTAPYSYKVIVKYEGKKGDKEYHYDNDTVSGTFEPQALGFSWPGICQVTGSNQEAVENTAKRKTYPDGHVVIVPREASGRSCSTFINVSSEYGSTVNSPYKDANGNTLPWPFCNARVCYKHYGLNEDGTTSSDVISLKDSNGYAEDHYPYWVLDADRPQSGICFYVLYFLDCLFAHLGVEFDKTALVGDGTADNPGVEDFKHLVFFTTKCAYNSVPITDSSHSFYTKDAINKWLTSRGCGGTVDVEQPESKQIQEFKYKKNNGAWETVKVGKNEVESITVEATLGKVTFSANVCKMIANSDNFPEESVKTILESLQNSFGIRFHYDYERNRVTAYLLRSVFRSQQTPIPFQGEVLEMHKMSEKITGFRMKYSAESTPKEQEQYIRRRKTDYDTDYDYREYPADRLELGKTFSEIAGQASATNMTVYVDPTTGNGYRFKVDNDTKSQARLFEVGQFHGVEVGLCTDEYEDFVKEYISDFQPISFNDVNFRASMGDFKERKVVYEGDTYTFKEFRSGDPMLVAYVDEDFEHEFVEQKINNVLSNDLVDLYLTEKLSLVESYDPSNTDDGNSPLQEYDWGLAVAMMRGGGTNMEIQNYDQGYDGFGNSRWRTVAGEYALTTDTMDHMGNEFDYNGTLTGIGDGERFSLKISAVKPFRYKTVDGKLVVSTNPAEWEGDATWMTPCNADVVNTTTGKIETKIRTRGLFETFMVELCYFLLHRKKYLLKVNTTVAALADIPNHWRERWQIGNKIGYINKVKYTLEVEKALTVAEIEFYAI